MALLCSALAIGPCGCWAAALAPLAVTAAEGAVATVAGVTEGAVVAAHQKAGDDQHPGEDEVSRAERCSELEMDAPGVIEVRKGAGGAPEYRQLQLAGALDRQQWTVLTDNKDTNAAGWRPAANLLAANFNPPLGLMPDTGSNYLAYRPLQSDSLTSPDPIAPMSANFGAATGTFTWNGQLYQFGLTHKLPCFPPPSP